jgi:hypothetical protein
MSQPDATLYIQPPMFETTVAAHITVNARWRNGAHAATMGVRCGAVVEDSFVVGAFISVIEVLERGNAEKWSAPLPA